MNRKWIKWVALMVFVGTIGTGRAEYDADWTMDYSSLTMDTLPPPAMVIDRVLKAAPYSAARLERWEKRIRRSAWLPQFRVDYVYREMPIHNYASSPVVERTFERGAGQSQSQTLFYDTDRVGGGPDQSFVETRLQETDTRTSRDPLHREMVREGQVFPTGQEMEWATEWRAMLLWDLSRLVFHHEESRAVDVQVRESNHRRVLIGEVARRYGELRQAVLSLDRDPDDMRWQTVRLVEASFLDAMSDYFITDYIKMKLLDREIEEERTRMRRAIEERRPDAVVPHRDPHVRPSDQYRDPHPALNNRYPAPTDPELLRDLFEDDDRMEVDDSFILDDLLDMEDF